MSNVVFGAIFPTQSITETSGTPAGTFRSSSSLMILVTF